MNEDVGIIATVTVGTLHRRGGIHLDIERLDYELARRGLSVRHFAQISGVPEATLSRARHGRAVRETTYLKMVEALLALPDVPGASMLIRPPL